MPNSKQAALYPPSLTISSSFRSTHVLSYIHTIHTHHPSSLSTLSMATSCLSFLEVFWTAFCRSHNLESKSLLAMLPIDHGQHPYVEAAAWPRAYYDLEIYAKQYYNTLNYATLKEEENCKLVDVDLANILGGHAKVSTTAEFNTAAAAAAARNSSEHANAPPPSPPPPASTSRFFANGPTKIATLFSRKGEREINQDSMLVIEDFTRLDVDGTVQFCGVFDGHGPHGHFVSRFVRDTLPQKLLSCCNSSSYELAMQSSSGDERESEGGCEQQQVEGGRRGPGLDSMSLLSVWKDCFVKAYELMDMELSKSRSIDCVSSGTTAISLVKLGNDLLLANVGDSRAVLGTVGSDGASPVAVQLTVDTRPDIPSEAERIRRCEGRIRALRHEPFVKRVWLPHHNAPGLAMSRVLGDFCIKRYGVISEPEVTHRRLTSQDKFVVLASDGVWDVLSNEEVVEIVAASERSRAAEAVVEAAVQAWKEDYETSKVDDCSVVCFFLDSYL